MTEFSIIIPLYNKERTIRNTLESVLRQDYPHFEIIVVDDGSTDGSVKIVQNLSDERIRLIRKENGGPSSARNLGAKNAKYSWVLFLDADDLLLDTALKTFSEAIHSFPDIFVFCANFYYVQHGNRRLFSTSYFTGMIQNPYKEWFFHRLMPRAGTCAMKKEIVQAYSFKEYLRRSEDVEVMFNVFRNTPVFRLETPVMAYHLDQATASRNRSSIDRDFQGHLVFKGGKPLWERINLYELYVEAKNNYPEEIHAVYPNMNRHFMLKFAYHCAFWYRAFQRNFKK